MEEKRDGRRQPTRRELQGDGFSAALSWPESGPRVFAALKNRRKERSPRETEHARGGSRVKRKMWCGRTCWREGRGRRTDAGCPKLAKDDTDYAEGFLQGETERTEGGRVQAAPRDWAEDRTGRRVCHKKRKKAEKYRSGLNHRWARVNTDTAGLNRRKPGERRSFSRLQPKIFGRKRVWERAQNGMETGPEVTEHAK